MSAYPATRMRRLRRHDWTRRLVAENTLSPADLIWPLFVIEGENKREPVASMPGVERLSVDLAAAAAKEAAHAGHSGRSRCFPRHRSSAEDRGRARSAEQADNLVCRAVRAIKAAVPEIGVLCDVALDPYTSHGHDGLDRATAMCTTTPPRNAGAAGAGAGRGRLRHHRAVRHDGWAHRRHPRRAGSAGHHNTLIMAYAAKYASAFYGPFRDAVGSARPASD